MVLDDLLDLRLHVGCHVSSRNLLEEGALGCGQMLTEFGLPFGDLIDGDGVELYRSEGQ